MPNHVPGFAQNFVNIVMNNKEGSCLLGIKVAIYKYTFYKVNEQIAFCQITVRFYTQEW